MQNASSILHGHVWDRAELKSAASQEAAPIPGVLFALPTVAGTVLTMGSIREKCPMSGLCVLERRERHIFIFLPTPSLATELIQSFLTYPRVKAIEKTPFPKLPALCFHFRILGEGCK